MKLFEVNVCGAQGKRRLLVVARDEDEIDRLVADKAEQVDSIVPGGAVEVYGRSRILGSIQIHDTAADT